MSRKKGCLAFALNSLTTDDENLDNMRKGIGALEGDDRFLLEGEVLRSHASHEEEKLVADRVLGPFIRQVLNEKAVLSWRVLKRVDNRTRGRSEKGDLTTTVSFHL